jgi:hypothetical protein
MTLVFSVTTQCLKNCGSKLCCVNLIIKYRLLRVRGAGGEGNFTVIIGQSSVLGNLGSSCGIDDTGLWPDNDVWHRWISLGITVSKIGKAIALNNVVDLEVITVPV